MKNSLILAALLIASPLSMAKEKMSSCSALAEKAAMSLYILENSLSDLQQLTDYSIIEVTKGTFRVDFIDNSGDTDESAVMYKIEMENFGSNQAPNCKVKSVQVDFAG